MPMRGLFQLKTAADLRLKLRSDFEKLEKDSLNAYAAFNFFVTAEHLLDWRYPGYANEPRRRAARDAEVLLQVTSHLANGAKHFEAEGKHHTSVARTGKAGGFFPSRYFSPRYFARRYFGGPALIVELDGQAAVKLGQSQTALELARQVLAYWDSQAL